MGIGLAATVYKEENITAYGGFLPFGFSGDFIAIPFAMFAFSGIRVLPDYAEESKSFRKLPLVITIVVVGQLPIYLMLDWFFVTIIDWTCRRYLLSKIYIFQIINYYADVMLFVYAT